VLDLPKLMELPPPVSRLVEREREFRPMRSSLFLWNVPGPPVA
jgi:hypothetical protein